LKGVEGIPEENQKNGMTKGGEEGRLGKHFLLG